MSVYSDILADVKTVVTSTLSSIQPANIHVRKRPEFRKSHDALPAVFIVPLAERIARVQFQDNLWVDYPVAIVIVIQSALTLTDVGTLLDYREDLRLALWKENPLPTVSGVFDVDYTADPLFDVPGLEAGFDVSVQIFTFRSSEPRS